MSGPGDRSSDPDAQWPTEDLGQSSGNRAARDPGTEGAPGWDDWPPAPPPPDDYLIEEPLPPSSDPWAESWTEEDADAMLRSASGEPAPQPDRWEAPAPDFAPQPEPQLQPEPQPQPEPEPRPPVEPAWRSEPQAAEPEAADVDVGATTPPPRIEPWSPDPDPWRFEPEPVQMSPAPAREPEPFTREAVAEPELEPEPETAEVVATPADEPSPPVDEPPPPAASWPPRTDHLPDWLAEPLPEDRPAPAAEPRAETAAPPADAQVDQPGDVPVETRPEPEPRVATPLELEPPAEPEAVAQPPVEEPEASHVPEPPEESAGFWDSILPWRSARAEPTEIDGGSEPRTEREPEPEIEPREARAEPDWPEAELPSLETDEPEAAAPAADAHAIEPRWPASVPKPEAELSWVETDEPEPQVAPPAPPPFVSIGGGLTYDRAEPEPELEAEPEPPPSFIPIGGGLTYDRAEPDLELEPKPTGPEPGPAPWPSSEWPDAGESTRVLPTDWTPSPPEPTRSGELEPSAGQIRVRLAEPDTDAELDEELANPTIAEQAVPWLIGVILLLAGMVIVLLALIFAGDGSLGGGVPNATPDPTLAAIAGGTSGSPTPSPTPAPTTSTPATPTSEPTREPTPTPEAVPQYKPLEMVYQGRSAALAPIYLLHRDFQVEEEPTVMAQDAEFDVRRFAWAPDGRVGAGLLADVLVSIEPGEEKRRLGDGLSTITFGDDASTVYAVRITEDGADDSATVLAVDFTSGETEELASVTYERPQLGDEAALAEAAFSDDGGAVRLFWMADDTLRLWVLGAGAWTIDPASGELTDLDGAPLPTLVAPNGLERITVDESDGVATLTRLDMNDRRLATTTVKGAVSHLRWSPGGDRVVFTVGRSASGGGILQNLFLWDLEDDEDPVQLTATGAAFGAEWRGSQPRWRE